MTRGGGGILSLPLPLHFVQGFGSHARKYAIILDKRLKLCGQEETAAEDIKSGKENKGT
jgi:hypothetical protein